VTFLKGVGWFVLVFLTHLIRGIGLWVVVPISCLVWGLALPVIAIARVLGRHPAASPVTYVRFGVGLMDGVVSRLLPALDAEPWPWEPGAGNRPLNLIDTI